MRSSLPILSCGFATALAVAGTPGARAEEPALAAAAAAAAAAAEAEAMEGALDLAIEDLLAERGEPADYDAAEARARAAGVGEQALLECRFLYHVDRGRDEEIAALLPKFLERSDGFRIEDSVIFSVEDDWLAVVEYLRALDALGRGDGAGFKTHITEAFWLSPGQGAAFAEPIERFRVREAMRGVTVDFEVALESLAEGGEEVALASLLEERRAMLLHFWSPWSRECEMWMPEFVRIAPVLEAGGVAVVSVLPDREPFLRGEAREIVAALGEEPPGRWLVDRESEPLHRLLRVRGVPTAVLVSPAGEVLYNGHPAREGMWKELRKLDPALARPAAGEED